MYKINRMPFGESFLLELRDSVTSETVTILPEYGGSIHQIIATHGGLFFPLLWSDSGCESFSDWGRNIYQGAVLFPFTDRIEYGKYRFDGRDFVLNCNDGDHALHGFLNDQVFSIASEIECEDYASVDLELEYKGDKPGYPFHFRLLIRYALNVDGLSIETKIFNKGFSSMPLSLGWHPYFLLNNPSNFQIEIPAIRECVIDADYICRGELIAYETAGPIKPEVQDGLYLKCFEWMLPREQIRLIQPDIPFIISLSTPSTNGYDFFQIYLHKDNAGIAIEPLTSPGNSFNHSVGLQTLGENAQRSFSFSISWK